MAIKKNTLGLDADDLAAATPLENNETSPLSASISLSSYSFGEVLVGYGSAGNDLFTLRAAYGGQVIGYGDDGDDIMRAYVNADLIFPGTGPSAAVIYGGAGNDTIELEVGGGGSGTIDAGDGDDTIRTSVSNGYSTMGESYGYALVNGGAGADYMSGDVTEIPTPPRPDGFPITTASADFFGGDGDDSMNYTVSGAGAQADINGDAGADTIIAQVENQATALIDGGAGDDFLGVHVTTGGAATVIDTAGANSFFVTANNGTLDVTAGDGDDSISSNFSEGARATVQSGAGNDYLSTIVSQGSNATFDAGQGDDEISLSADYSQAFAYGGDGRDRLIVTIASDGARIYLDGGNDDDNYNLYSNVIFDPAEIRVADTAGANELTANVVGGTLDVSFGVGEDKVTVDGLWSGARATVQSGAGNDSVQVYANEASQFTVDAGDGDDGVVGSASGLGTAGTLDAGAGLNSVAGYAYLGGTLTLNDTHGGTNFVLAVAGYDSTINVNGGAGADSYNFWVSPFADAGVDNSHLAFQGGNDGDYIRANVFLGGSIDLGLGSGEDIVDLWMVDGTSSSITDKGGANFVSLAAYSGTHDISLGDGADFLSAGLNSGAQLTARSGAGSDRIMTNSHGLGTLLTADAGLGNDSIEVFSYDEAQSFVSGGAGDDSITAFVGLAGMASLDGNDGDDAFLLQAGEGAVIFANGGAGTDQISLSAEGIFNADLTARGGLDDDIITGQGAARFRLYGDEGNDWIEGGDSHDLLYGGEGADIARGGLGNDIIYGGAGLDSLRGDGGSDSLFGENGNDYLAGGDGDDRMNGGAGNDLLFGEQGNDRLIGGAGNDLLYGGAGADRFVVQDTLAANVDRVMDFSLLDGDRLDLTPALSGVAPTTDLIASGYLQVTKVVIDGVTYASVNIDANGNSDRLASFKQAALVKVDNFEDFANSQFWTLT